MRGAKVQDYWRKAYKRNYKNSLLKINLNKLNNLYEIEFSKGLVAICGLNGAGKSTIISALKDVVGLHLTNQDMRRIGTHQIEGAALLNKHKISCKNIDNERLFDKDLDRNLIKYVDCMLSTMAQDYMIEQTNFEEVLEQYDNYQVTEEELKDINYLVGKSYSYCSIIEIDDIDDEETKLPFFQVKVDDIEYDSRNMGNGEHFLLYLFWCIKSLNRDTILIVEEPETFISIFSQMHFADYIGKMMAENGVNVILTTHSPYILKNIKNENIRVVSRVGKNVSITSPDGDFTVEKALGIKQSYFGTFFVEDKVASNLLTVILEDKAPWLLQQYAIDIVDGESAISERLKFPKSKNIYYNFIGIYDGDMRNTLENTSKFNWKYCFLPGEHAVEEIFREYLRDPNNLDKLCDALGKEKDKVIAFLATIDGRDYHDWFLDFCKHLHLDTHILISVFYSVLMNEDPSIDAFVCELQKVVDEDN